MQKLSVQAPRAVVMIRPHHFGPNSETAGDNLFQATDAGRNADEIAASAKGEVTRAAAMLEESRAKRNAWLAALAEGLTPEELAVMRQAAPVLEKLAHL